MTYRKSFALLVPILLVVPLFAACSSGGTSASDTATAGETSVGSESTALAADPGTETAIDYGSLSGTIMGSGASFPDAYYQEVITSFLEVAPNMNVTYNSVGSGTGKQEFGANLTEFAGSDSLVKDGDGPKAGEFLYVPTTAAPITISYNLSGVTGLQLSAETLAKIFQRDITTWNDAAIVADNPGVELPSIDIVVAHRADGSGTTSNFTKYLVAAAPDTWKLGAGDTVAWPAATQAGQKNTGVAQIVKNRDGAIGYVDLSDAKATGLTFASIQNKAGNYVSASLAGTSAALAGATVGDDLSYSPLNADGADAYPITAPTFVLVRTTYPSQETLDAVKGFLTYLLTDGQDLAEAVDFGKLPDNLRQKSLTQLDTLTVG